MADNQPKERGKAERKKEERKKERKRKERGKKERETERKERGGSNQRAASHLLQKQKRWWR